MYVYIYNTFLSIHPLMVGRSCFKTHIQNPEAYAIQTLIAFLLLRSLKLGVYKVG
jgi:hypothetical protein